MKRFLGVLLAFGLLLPPGAFAISTTRARTAINRYEARQGGSWEIGLCRRSDGYVVCDVTRFDRTWFGQNGWTEEVVDCVDKRGRVSEAGTTSDKNDNCLWASTAD